MRLIDADELLKQIKYKPVPNILDETWNELYERVLEEIDNAPTFEQKEFEQVLQPIKVNIPEDIMDKLIEEQSKPRKVILDESDPVKDCIIAYGNGFDSARRLFERFHGKWIFKHNSSDIWCSVCDENFDEIPQKFNYCPNCGADMREDSDE